jgi:hypothetical protein
LKGASNQLENWEKQEMMGFRRAVAGLDRHCKQHEQLMGSRESQIFFQNI